MSRQERECKPTALKVVKYWLSKEGIEKRNKLNEKYQTGEDGKGFFFPCDIDYPHCFACNLPSHKWHRKLELCHIEPWCLGKNQDASNFVLMCRSCHKASPTIENVTYLWKWIYNRQTSTDVIYNNLKCLTDQSLISEYIHQCDQENKDIQLCLWFDMFMLDDMGKLTEVIYVGGELPLSSISVLLADIFSMRVHGFVPSEVFSNDEIREIYLIYQQYAYEFERNKANGNYENIFIVQLSKYLEIYRERTNLYLTSKGNQRGLFDHAV